MSQQRDGSGSPPPGNQVSPLAPAPNPPPAELAMRLRGMLCAPGTAFEPPLSRWVWLAPLILLSLFAFGGALLSANLWIREGLAANPNGAAALEQMQGEKMAWVRVVMGVGVLATTWLGYLVPAVIFWFGLNFLLGGRAGFGAVLGVTAFTGLVMLPRDVLLTILRLHADTVHIYTSPAVLADPEQKATIALAEHLDVFALYRLILLAFGFRSISGLTGKQTGWLVGLLWVLGAGFSAGLALLGKSFGR
jgi:hypothetical protein